MPQKRLAGFQRNTGSSQSFARNCVADCAPLSRCLALFGSLAFRHARFHAELLSFPVGLPRYVNTNSLCIPRRDSITRWAIVFNTTTRSVLVLVMDSGKMKTEVSISGTSTSQSQRSWQTSCSRQPVFTANSAASARCCGRAWNNLSCSSHDSG